MQAGADPDHLAALGGRRRGPHDERIVGVGDDTRGRQGAHRLAPGVGDLAHLVAAVELVAAEVEQQDRGRSDLVQDRRQPPLVDLEGGDGAGLGPPPSAATRPGGHVGAEELDTTGPWVARAAASRWVVVVLPLVALTRAISRPTVSRPSSSRSMASERRPPMTLPVPRWASFDAPATVRPAPTATRLRSGSVVWGPAIRRPIVAVAAGATRPVPLNLAMTVGPPRRVADALPAV